MSLLPVLARRASARPVVVLDDDPTGTQTVRDLPVLTEWTAERIARHLGAGEPAIFLSTNSRALDERAAMDVTRDAVTAALAATGRAGRPVSIVSRSDSTLRGHFPAETLAIAEAMRVPDARVVLAPFFAEGGRVTVDDVHLLERDGVRVAAADTEFAQDTTFGYRSSSLRDWVAEKCVAAGRPVPPVESVRLETVHAGPAAVAGTLAGIPPGGVAIANAETDADIESIALGALMAEEAGLPLVARSAASYVRARAGQPSAQPLSTAELGVAGPGLVVVGSHVPTTSAQLDALFAAAPHLLRLEMTVDRLLRGDRGPIVQAASALDSALADGRTGVIMTERTRRDVDLAGGRQLSAALVETVRRIARRPEWVVAKGGITSYDVARHGLGMAEARIVGPLLPGVPVWIGGEGSRWPGLPLVVFAGNVGGRESLADAHRLLTGAL